MADAIQLDQAQRWRGKGKPQWYRLASPTFGTLCGADGRATEEGELDEGLIVRLGGISSDTNPWTHNAQYNRPSGACVRDVTGAAWIIHRAELIPVTQEDADAQLAEIRNPQ